MHFSGALKKVVLHIEVAVVGALGIPGALLDYAPVADDEAQSGESHQSLLGRRHTEVDVVLFDVDRAHSVGACCVDGENRVVPVSELADLPDGVQDSGAGFILYFFSFFDK